MKKIVRIAALLLAFALTYMVTDGVLCTKALDGVNTLKKYYALPPDTVDVLFVGSSHVGSNLDMSLMMEEYGIAGYKLWGGMQSVWNSYYYLKEGLKSQKPRVAVAEVFLCGNDEEYSDTVTALGGVLGMKPSLDKLKLAMCSFPTWQEAAEALWGMPIYHSRYDELSLEDIRAFEPQDTAIQKQQYKLDATTPLTMLDYASIADTHALAKKQETYVRKMIGLCKAQGIPLILLLTPYQATEEEATRFNELERIAAEEGVFCWNYVRNFAETGIDPATDFYDIGHLNTQGGIQFSRLLAQRLTETFDLPDRRTDETHIWNKPETREAPEALYRLEETFVGDGDERCVDTGVKLYENPLGTWTLQARLDLQDFEPGGVCLSCYNEEEEQGAYGFQLKKENEDTILLKLGAEREWYLPCAGSAADVAIVKRNTAYTVYVNGEAVIQDEKLPCSSYAGPLLIGCQERLSSGERYNFSRGHVLNLEIYGRALDAQTIAAWSPETLPEAHLPLGLFAEAPEVVYTLPEQFVGGGEDFDQDAYLDTNLRLLDEAGTRFTLLARVTPQRIQGDRVFFSCFSEEQDHYRGILVRQWDDRNLNVIVGANYGVEIPIEPGRPVNLAIVKDGSAYTVYADGEKVLDRVESRAEVYGGTLLIGAQRDAKGGIFRVSKTRVNSLTVMSGAMDEADILAYDFADAPEPARIEPSSVQYRLEQPFAGDGRDNYVDTGVMLYDAPAKDWTLQAVVRTKEGADAGVYFSCFSEDGNYRGLMLRQDYGESVTLYMGELRSHTFDLTDRNRTLNLVVVKQGDAYRVYANGEFCAGMEVSCSRYRGPLLVGCQADADGGFFRFSKARVDALEVQDGAVSEAEALKLSAQKAAVGRFN